MKTPLKQLKKTLKDKLITDEHELFCYSREPMLKDTPCPPSAVVLPETAEDVIEVMKIANEYNIPVVARGAGTNHVGASLTEGVVVHFSKMNKIISVNKLNLSMTVQAGTTIEDIQTEAEKHNLFYPPDPSNLKVSTIAGGIALSSSGARFFKYGGVKDYIRSMKVVLADGTVLELGSNVIKNSTGYNLKDLFIGSEGTLGIITEVTLKLIPRPEAKQLALLYFDSVERAYECSNKILDAGIFPSMMDMLDKLTLETIEDFAPAGFDTTKEAMLLVEVDGNRESVKADIEKLKTIADIVIPDDKERVIFSRRSAFAALSRFKPNVITEDPIVLRDKIPEMIKKVKELSKKYNITTAIMGHIADGNIHPNFALDYKIEKENFKKLKDELFNAVIEMGGTLSGEHGIGIAKSGYLDKVFSETKLDYMRKTKQLFDPKGILGKTI